MSNAAQLSFHDRHYHLFRRLHSLTGIAPIGVFLISHLTTNSSLVWGALDARHRTAVGEGGHAGAYAFQHEVNFIHSIPFLLLIEIFGLWLPIAFHSVLGFYYAFTGKGNARHYNYQANWRYTLQRISGYVGFFFILYHVATLRWGWTFLIPGGTKWSAEYAASTLGAALQGSTDGMTPAGLLVSAFYMLGVSLLVFHFANGLWTAAITWGVTISDKAQQRWGYVCAALGTGLMVMGWSATIAAATLDQDKARQAEELLRLHGDKPPKIDPVTGGDAPTPSALLGDEPVSQPGLGS
ncbi:MAG: succinate dehydrogenase cytochrome b558 subunit [Planctomycetota bacterium]|nr:succinate dehydrogenase cytochrome b558 subunit [Planctomycetota bacterium]